MNNVDNVDKLQQSTIFPPFFNILMWITWITLFRRFFQNMTFLYNLPFLIFSFTAQKKDERNYSFLSPQIVDKALLLQGFAIVGTAFLI